ncbi:MAG: hypothetical protein V4690_01850 [Patescibacteria group bacterium]
MRLVWGTTRIVLIIPVIGIVLKLPVLEIARVSKVFFRNLFRGKFRSISIEMHEYWGFLFSGIIANWSEYRFYQRTRHTFLQPTYFSLFGLFNIQKLGNACNMKTLDVWCQLVDITSKAVWADPHCFDEADNFCFDNKQFKMLDYASEGAQKVVLSHGDKIVQFFNPNYSWEEEKKKLKEMREQRID